MRVLAYGERAVLVEVEDLPRVVALAGALRGAPVPGTVDLVPSARTVLVRADRPIDPTAVSEHISRLDPVPDRSSEPAHGRGPVDIEVEYDGEDLDAVAAATGLTRAEVVAAHVGTDWTVAFCGFAPGFAYLIGGDARLKVPRRREPRTRVPAGTVALADGYSAVYPSASPGGWQLIGHTGARVWDAERDPPALLLPGTVVRFRAASQE